MALEGGVMGLAGNGITETDMAQQTEKLDRRDREIRRLRHELQEQIRLNADLQGRNGELERRITEIFNISVGVAR